MGKLTHGIYFHLLSLTQARIILEGWFPHLELQAGGAHERKGSGLEKVEHVESFNKLSGFLMRVFYPQVHNTTWAVLLPSDRTGSLCTQHSNTSERECYGADSTDSTKIPASAEGVGSGGAHL